MKRIGNIYTDICDIDNVEEADNKARKHKTTTYGVRVHDKNRQFENYDLADKLANMEYRTSEYSLKKIYEPKERLIFRLPYYPDRIVHHAIMNYTESIWTKIFIKNTYACIKKRGIHKLVKDLKIDLKRHQEQTKYCLKLDITKFYPSIDHDILFEIIKKKIKDPDLLKVLREIIDSAPGVPIGNYLSQFFANLYLAYFDHWMKEEVKCVHYYRYADDIVILSDDKEWLHKVLILIKLYLKHVLKLSIKSNYQIFPVDSRGIDFVGYKFYHTYTLLRKSIKKKLMKLTNSFTNCKINKEEYRRRIQSYFGWLKYCNSKNLLHKIYKMTGLWLSNWKGIQANISSFYEKNVYIVHIDKFHKKYFRIEFLYKGKPYTVKSNSKTTFFILKNKQYPLLAKLRKWHC